MRILALDVGERRVGVAVSDPTKTVARPLHTLVRATDAEHFAEIGELVEEHSVELVIVGQPLTLRGEVGGQAQEVRRYASALAEKLSVPIQMWDERYSTVAAEEILQHGRKKKTSPRKKKEEVDSIAAAVILQSFLDSQVMREIAKDVDGLEGDPSGL
jgi:putative Holliday junction resolvase